MFEQGATRWNPHEPNGRRSLLLAAVGAIAGLVLAGFGLFTAHGTRTAGVPAEDVALVNGVPILRADYDAQLRLAHDVSPSRASRAQARQTLDRMIDEELAVQRGLELNMAVDDVETRTALVNAVRGALATDILAAVPDDATLARYFAAHRARYADQGRMTLLALRAPSAPVAAEAVAALRRGEAAATVTRRFGLRSTGQVDNGEEFYFAAAIHLGPRLFAVARALRNGEVSDPVPDPHGSVILVMLANRPPTPRGFAEARDRVRVDYTRAALARMEAANAAFLRKRGDVVIAPDLR